MIRCIKIFLGISLLLIIFSSCASNKNKSNLTALYWNQGEVETLRTRKAVQRELDAKIQWMLGSCHQQSRTASGDEWIENIKNERQALEIIFEEPRVLQHDKFGSIEYKGVFFTLNSKGAKKGQNQIVYLSNSDGYSVPPLIMYANSAQKALILKKLRLKFE